MLLCDDLETLSPGGELLYARPNRAPLTGLRTKLACRLPRQLRTPFTDIVPLRRLAYVHLADFIPGVEPVRCCYRGGTRSSTR